jgi:hypothetical protein
MRKAQISEEATHESTSRQNKFGKAACEPGMAEQGEIAQESHEHHAKLADHHMTKAMHHLSQASLHQHHAAKAHRSRKGKHHTAHHAGRGHKKARGHEKARGPGAY